METGSRFQPGEQGICMAEGEKASGSGAMGALQVIHLLVTIVLAVATFWFNWSNEQDKRAFAQKQEDFNQSIKRIETDLKLKQDERTAHQAVEALRITLFTHVSTVLEKEKSADRQRLAARSLVTSLLETEDQLRIGLVQALAESATDKPAQKELNATVANETEFRSQEAASLAEAIKLAGAAGNPPSALKSYVVDVFTCEKDGGALVNRATQVKAALDSIAKPRPLRVLFESVNASPGFRVSGLQIRHTPDELAAAEALRAELKKANQGDFTLRLVKKVTPNYLSVFVCN
jgi:hypothetical protein